MTQRIPRKIWDALLAATVCFKQTVVAAIDGTYFSRNNASFHYLKRTKQDLPLKKAVQCVALLDTRRKKWLAQKTRLVRRHESKDLDSVINASVVPFEKLVADKASDSEAVHKFCTAKSIEPHIPPRRNVRKGMQRKKHLALFRTRTYHRRSMIEAAFSRLKRGQGGFVKNRSCKGIRGELSLRFVNDNLNLLKAILRDFQQSHADTMVVVKGSPDFSSRERNSVASALRRINDMRMSVSRQTIRTSPSFDWTAVSGFPQKWRPSQGGLPKPQPGP